MDNEDIVNYVMDNPENTNPAVLRGLLDQLNGGGSGGMAQIKLTITEHTDDTVSVNKPYLQFLSELQAASVDQGVEYGLSHVEVLATIIYEYSDGATGEEQIILRPCTTYVTINSQNIQGHVLSRNAVELNVNMDNTEESPSMTIDKSGYLWYPVGDDTDTITKISGLYFDINGYFD